MTAARFDAARFMGALREDAQPPVLGFMGETLSDRFRVYQNNVVGGLVKALAARFPVIEKLVGQEFFRAAAAAFVTAHPPTSPIMALYGCAFPRFLARFPPALPLPYLSDVARLEYACGEAFHAADTPGLIPSALVALDPERAGELVLTLHPSVRIVRSIHPIVTIWTVNRAASVPGPITSWTGEDALVCREDDVVVVERLMPGEAAFLSLLLAGAPLAKAAAAAAAEVTGFDAVPLLARLIGPGLVTGISSDALEEEKTTP